MNLQINKILFSVALILLLAFSAFMAITPSAKAQTSSTPQNWINLVTQTPGGAWRPESGVNGISPRQRAPGGDLAATCYTNSTGPKTNHVLWRAEVPLYAWASLAVDYGSVFALSRDAPVVYRLDQNTGEVIWASNTAVDRDLEVQVVKDSIYFTARNQSNISDHYPVALSMATGYQSWTGPDASGLAIVCPVGTALANGDAIYVAGNNNWVACYDRTGRTESNNRTDLEHYKHTWLGFVV